MKRLFVIVLIIGISACINFLPAQVKVFHLSELNDTIQREGVFYSLPRTFIKVDVSVKKAENIKGPYSVYANKFLGLKNVINNNSVTYKISDIKISTFSEPDPGQYYFVDIQEQKSEEKNKKIKKQLRSLIYLNEAGLIESVNIKPDEKKSDETIYSEKSEKHDYPDLFKYYADANLFERIDTIIETVDMDTITIEKQVLKKTMVTKSLEQKAQEAADYIIKVKESRYNLISGYQEVSYDAGSIEYMNKQLENLENEYLTLFTGITLNKTLKYSYTYLPEIEKKGNISPLFNFYKKQGVIDVSNPGGEKVVIQVIRKTYTQKLHNYFAKNKTIKKFGFYYRIPEYADVIILYNGKVQASSRCLISQFGVVTQLPDGNPRIQFYSETGGIKSAEAVKGNE